jgi:AraC-like DNA-binding protein
MKYGELILPEYVSGGYFDLDQDVKFHEHSSTELVFVVEGQCKLQVDKIKLYGKPGTLFILPANIPHSQINKGRVQTLYTVFKSCSYFDDSARTLYLGRNSLVGKWLEDIYTLNKEPHDEAGALISGLLYSIICSITEQEGRSSARLLLPVPLQQAIEYIDQNFHKTIGLKDVSREAGVSSGHLCLLFKQYMKTSPMIYIIELRLQYARRLLKNSYLSVKEVGTMCGFNDSNYFCRRFLKKYGCSPGSFRKSIEDIF